MAEKKIEKLKKKISWQALMKKDVTFLDLQFKLLEKADNQKLRIQIITKIIHFWQKQKKKIN